MKIKKLLWLPCVVLLFSPNLYAGMIVTTAQTDLEKRVARLERMANNPVLLRLSERLSQQQREISNLNDRIDRLTFQLKKAKHQSDKQYQDIDARLTALESRKVPVATPALPVTPIKTGSGDIPIENRQTQSDVKPVVKPVVQPNAKSKSVKVTSASSGAEEKNPIVRPKSNPSVVPSEQVIQTHPATIEELEAYQASFKLMKEKHYNKAIQAFSAFKTQYPTSRLASNAGYWMGEAYAVQNQYKEAIQAFSEVVRLYPTSTKAAPSLLRWADIEGNLNHLSKAKSLYERIIRDYPKNRNAQKAKARLKALGKEQ